MFKKIFAAPSPRMRFFSKINCP